MTSISQEVYCVGLSCDTHSLPACSAPSQNQRLWQVCCHRLRRYERRDLDEQCPLLIGIAETRTLVMAVKKDNLFGVITLTAIKEDTAVGNRTRSVTWKHIRNTWSSEKKNASRTVKSPETWKECWVRKDNLIRKVINWHSLALGHLITLNYTNSTIEHTNSFSLTIPCAICQEKDIMSCGVIESSSSLPVSCSSSFTDWTLLNLTSMLLSAFEKATLLWPRSFAPGPQCCKFYEQD